MANPIIIADGVTTTFNITFGDNTNLPQAEIQIRVDTSVARTINLDELGALSQYGLTVIVSDDTGTAATHNITINAGMGNTINGSSSLILNTNNASWILKPVGKTKWAATASSNSSTVYGGVYTNQAVITLGTISYTQLNAAPATIGYTPAFTYSLPAGKLFQSFLVKTDIAFVQGSGVFFSLSDVSVSALGLVVENPQEYINDTNIVNNVLAGFQFTVAGPTPVVNPKNFTAGHCTVYAITCDSPV